MEGKSILQDTSIKWSVRTRYARENRTCNFKVISNLLNLKQIKLITDIIEHVCTYFYVTILYKYYGSLQSEYVNIVTVDGKQ